VSSAAQASNDIIPPVTERPVKVLQVAGLDHVFTAFLKALIVAMQAEGWQVDAAAGSTENGKFLRSRNIRFFELPYGRARNIFTNFRRFRQLVKLIRRERYDIVHTHNPLASLIARAAARFCRVPIIIYTVHGFSFHENASRLRYQLGLTAERLAGRWTQLTFSQSREDYDLIVRKRIAPSKRVIWIGNGVNPAFFDPSRFSAEERQRIRASLGIPGNARVVGMLTRLSREKGIREFIEAGASVLSRMPDTWFCIVGGRRSGAYWHMTFDEVRSIAEKHGLASRLVLPGYREDVPEMLAAMDVFCLPSYHEGLPRSIIEAMAMELPVVASDIRGCREEVVDGETGFLVPVRDSRTLADKLTYLLENPHVASEFGRRARRIVLEDFVEENVVQKQITVIKQALVRNRRE